MCALLRRNYRKEPHRHVHRGAQSRNQREVAPLVRFEGIRGIVLGIDAEIERDAAADFEALVGDDLEVLHQPLACVVSAHGMSGELEVVVERHHIHCQSVKILVWAQCHLPAKIIFAIVLMSHDSAHARPEVIQKGAEGSVRVNVNPQRHRFGSEPHNFADARVACSQRHSERKVGFAGEPVQVHGGGGHEYLRQ